MVGKIKNEHLSITIVSQLTFQAVFLSLSVSASSFRLVSRKCQFAFAADWRCADHSGGEERDAPLLHVVFVSFVYHKFSTNCRVCLAAFLLRRIPFTLYHYFGHHIMTLTLTCGNLMLMTLISSDTNKPGVAVAAPEVTSTPSTANPLYLSVLTAAAPPPITLNTILVDRWPATFLCPPHNRLRHERVEVSLPSLSLPYLSWLSILVFYVSSCLESSVFLSVSLCLGFRNAIKLHVLCAS